MSICFFDMGWNFICSKASEAPQISSHFYIAEEILLDPDAIHKKTIAQRMSWAAHRQATRTEDLAYSLLGIFDINMTMQYGEGNGAFVRLQKEIMRNTDDLSLFAWSLAPPESLGPDRSNASQGPEQISNHGMFADHPNDFEDCKDVVFFHRHAAGVRIEEQHGNVTLRAPMISSNDLPFSITRWIPFYIYWIALLPCGIEGAPHKILGLVLCPYNQIGTTSSDHLRTLRYVIMSPKGIATFLIASELAIKANSMQIHIDSSARIKQNSVLGRKAGYQRILTLKCKTDQILDVSFLGSDEWRITEREPCTFSCSDRSYGADQPELVLRYSTRTTGGYLFVYALIKMTADHHDLLKLACYERAYNTELPWKRARTSGTHQYIEFNMPGEPAPICAKLETRFIYNQSVSTLTIYDQTHPEDDGEDDDVNSACSNEAYAA